MIAITNLCKRYYTEEVETTALDNISLRIDAGEFVSVMGPSGCGKSTFLSIIGLLDAASDGEYRLLGEEATRLSERDRAALRKRHIGFVFQSFNLIDELTIYENVALPLQYLGARPKDRKERVERALGRMGLLPRRNHFPSQLSGGQQQRATLARAIVSEPQLILADEPTGNLDSKNGLEVMSLLKDLNNQGTTIVMVTHAEDFSRFAGRAVHLFDGAIVRADGVGETNV